VLVERAVGVPEGKAVPTFRERVFVPDEAVVSRRLDERRAGSVQVPLADVPRSYPASWSTSGRQRWPGFRKTPRSVRSERQLESTPFEKG